MKNVMAGEDGILMSIRRFIIDMSSRGIVVNDLNKLMKCCERIADAGNHNPLDILMHVVKTGRKMDIHFYADDKVISELKAGEYDFYLKSVYGFTPWQVSVFTNSVGVVS